MLISMTGFGKAEKECGSRKFVAEVRSLNSKQLDLNVKLPYAFRELEMEIRSIVAQSLTRGKVDFTIYIEETVDSQVPPINADVFAAYYKQIQTVVGSNGLSVGDDHIVQAILRLPDVLKSTKPEISDEQKCVVKEVAQAALGNLLAFRQQEGAVLQNDLLLRVSLITDYLKQVEPFENNRIADLRKRLTDSLNGISKDINIDKDRFEQEMIFYLEKLDITEEKVRLQNHCRYFVETASQPEPAGRKLGFIAQEMGREINTLGSKACQLNIQKLVVMMKDELEKIKEQALNVL